ncbi:hypothetical protein PVK06_007403 [Gossypium arboreum]|uniref:Uncharacterized protein n=1 Tax=Gossypium arboreum TaxID=29729 RepID=A0ABR0QI87_GOSAR|nr:hypothetical protein PVK06_007403 [Gossypium arboreum]
MRADLVASKKREDTTAYGPWMLVERKSRRNSRNNGSFRTENKEKGKSGSRFGALTSMEGNKSSRLGGIILENGLPNAIIADSDINRPMVGSTLRAVGSNIGERAEDPKLANVIQASTLEGSKNQALGPTQNDPEGENNIEDTNISFKTVDAVPELIEIQSANISEGLNSNSHTSILFKEKEAADNSNMGKISLQDLDASKI